MLATFEKSSRFRPLRRPMKTLHELCEKHNVPHAQIAARIAALSKAGKPISGCYQPNGRGQRYYNPRQFSEWLDQLA